MNKLLIPFLLLILACSIHADKSLYSKFFGIFSGQIEVDENQIRNLEVEIKPAEKGFNISWKTIKSDQSGSGKTKAYSINFAESDRSGIYGSAMKTNLFGGQEALDPMKGEPYFWAKVKGNTLTVFGMLIAEDGNYEIQRYDRTLEGNQMNLVYSLSNQEKVIKTITGQLTRK